MYADYFGFREKPFNLTPDPRFFYSNPVYQEAYANLLYGVWERKGFIVLTGEAGTGKTTLLRRLMDSLEPHTRFVFFYNTALTFEELLAFACEELGLSVQEQEGRLQRMQALSEFLVDQLRQGGTGVFLIDEAQNLGEEVLENLRMLSNLETAREKLLQIVLVGQPELEHKLDQPRLRQLRQRIAVRCRLDRLKEWEVGPFIDCRLRAAGCKQQDLFAPEAIKRIAFYSKGIPRLINTLCDGALLLAYATSRKKVSGGMVEEVAQDLRLKEKGPLLRVEGELLKTDLQKSPTPAGGEEPFPQRSGLRLWPGILLVLFFLAGAASLYALQARGQLVSVGLRAQSLWQRAGEFLHPLKQRLDLWLDASLPGKASPLPESKGPSSLSQEGDGVGRRASVVPQTAVEEKSRQAPSQGSPLGKGKGPEVPSGPGSREHTFPSGKGGRSIIIRQGATVSETVLKGYGSYSALALDLIKEWNPHIQDLDLVLAGERLFLPPLDRKALVGKQPDGSYRLILGSYRSLAKAERLAQAARRRGYGAKVVPRRVSRTLTLYRVEIGGLQGPGEVDQAWDLVDTSGLFYAAAAPAADR